MDYDLLEQECWIPAQDLQGEIRHYSIRGVLQAAPQLRQIVHDRPLAVSAISRLLLAVLYRSYRYLSGKNWHKAFEKGEFDACVFDYIKSDRCQGKFDLFCTQYPFFQTAEFQKDNGVTTSVKKLVPDYSTGSNKLLWSHLADNKKFSISASEAAIQLLVCQYFSLGGGVSGSSNLFKKHPNFTNAPLVGGAVVMVEGENLFQTLMLNLKMPKDKALLDDSDLPVWEQTDSKQEAPKARAMRGLTDYLTWRSRHVRLIAEEDGSVSEMHFSQGLPTPEEMPREPYFAYRLNKDEKMLPVRLSFARSCWRDTANLLRLAEFTKGKIATKDLRPAGVQLLATLDNRVLSGLTLNCQLIGLDNNKANPLSWFNERLPLPANLVQKDAELGINYSELLVNGLRTAEAMFYQLENAVRVFARHLLPDGARVQDVNARVSAINPDRFYWPRLNEGFEQFVWALSTNTDDANAKWRALCIGTAMKAFEGATVSWRYGGSKVKKGLGLASQQLERALYGREWQSSQYWSEDTQTLVAKLEQWANPEHPNREILAALKKSLDQQKSTHLAVMPYLAHLLSDDLTRAETQAFVAGLFASHNTLYFSEKHQSFGKAWQICDGSERPGMSFRFECLLEAKGEQLKQTLRQMVQILKSKDIAIDYRTLMEDLYHWDSDDKRIQLKWARDYWAKPIQSDESTNSADATN
ncbi:type I-E CRISPR-associated protein Cse1/CasA [Pseudoalteromonas viridis]|uniref:Type I-E CRISPR-associated protein Cse1/CasA n=1 Tax=Pseudoalteromonas viridis TaxID=339617 RepID=A0ABX7VDW0_9GAMM|nr:type I-E CRISPR-associated protein Cse1/CasA [Pseudoalteromonas viridis]QTL37747.1 type I-E CRISPR-associated protein Cse1/CasA [Pseudoalteromonas viridis]